MFQPRLYIRPKMYDDCPASGAENTVRYAFVILPDDALLGGHRVASVDMPKHARR
jgi:hypothetical protein